MAWLASSAALLSLRCTVEIAPLDRTGASQGGGAGRDAGSDVASEAGAAGSSGAGATDAGSDADADVADAPDATRVDGGPCQCGTPDCGKCPTTTTIAIANDGYRVDATEVSVADYLEFLAARPSLDAQPSVCSFNQSYTPTCDWSPPPTLGAAAQNPVHCIDWCDAQAYCTWAKKYLCGGPRGVTLSTEASLVDANVSQWFRACSAAGTRRYPYGPDHVSEACNDSALQPVLAPVGTFPACEGGTGGLLDMVGNVAEWTNVYLSSVGSAATQGGGIADLYADCKRVERFPIQRTDPAVGFRCCSD